MHGWLVSQYNLVAFSYCLLSFWPKKFCLIPSFFFHNGAAHASFQIDSRRDKLKKDRIPQKNEKRAFAT